MPGSVWTGKVKIFRASHKEKHCIWDSFCFEFQRGSRAQHIQPILCTQRIQHKQHVHYVHSLKWRQGRPGGEKWRFLEHIIKKTVAFGTRFDFVQFQRESRAQHVQHTWRSQRIQRTHHIHQIGGLKWCRSWLGGETWRLSKQQKHSLGTRLCLKFQGEQDCKPS